MASIGDLFVKLGFDVDDAKLKAFDGGIKSLRNGMALLSAEAVGTVYALEKIATKSMAAATSVANLKAQFNLDPKFVQFWQQTAQASNPAATPDVTAGSLSSLAQKLWDARHNGVGLPAFASNYAHISPTDSPEDALEKLRALQSSNYDQTTKTMTMQSLGVSPEMTQVLQMSKSAQDAMFLKNGGGQTNLQDIADSAKAVGALNVQFTNLENNLTHHLIPAIQYIVDALGGLNSAANDRVNGKEPTTLGGKIVRGSSGILGRLQKGREAIDDAREHPDGYNPLMIGAGATSAFLRDLFGVAPPPNLSAPPATDTSQKYKLFGYNSQKEMDDAKKVEDFQNKKDPVWQQLQKKREEAVKKVLTIDGDDPAVNLIPEGKAGQPIFTPQPAAGVLDAFTAKDRRVHPESYLSLPDKPTGQQSSNSVSINVYADGADAKEVAQHVNRYITAYSQVNNSGVV